MYFLKICVYSACVTLLHGVLVSAQISMQFDSKSFIFVLAKDFLLEWLIHYKKDNVGLNLIYFLSGIWDTLKFHINDFDPLFNLCFVNLFLFTKCQTFIGSKKIQNIKNMLTGAIVNESWMNFRFSN